jgi:hypothetical protein
VDGARERTVQTFLRLKRCRFLVFHGGLKMMELSKQGFASGKIVIVPSSFLSLPVIIYLGFFMVPVVV